MKKPQAEPMSDVIVIPDNEDVYQAPPELIEGDPDADAPISEISADQPKLPPSATLLADRTIVVRLEFPIELKFARGGVVEPEHYGELHLHRLTGDHMQRLAATKEGPARTTTLLSSSTRISHARCAEILKRIDAADLSALSEALGFLLGSGRATGR